MKRLLFSCVVPVAFVVAFVGACDQHRDIQVLFGPSATDLSIGFQCRDSNGVPLIRSAVIPGTGTLRFQLVIDLVRVGNRLPGCRGEEIIGACVATGGCSLQPSTEERFCETVELDVSGLDDEAAIIAQLRAQLHDTPAGRIIYDAPDVPLIVRAVVTAEACSSVQRIENGRYQALDGASALGCAYSCPFVPDTVVGSISLGLDGLDANCEANMRLCAQLPTLP